MLGTCEEHSEAAQARWQADARQAGGCPQDQPFAAGCPPAGSTLLPRQCIHSQQSDGQRKRMQPAPCPDGISYLQAREQIMHLQACEQPLTGPAVMSLASNFRTGRSGLRATCTYPLSFSTYCRALEEHICHV